MKTALERQNLLYSAFTGDNPFMAGAFHGFSEPECALNIGVSGPGVVLAAVKSLPQTADFGELANKIKTIAFKITTTGELIGRELAKRLNVPFGVIDLSLAPTPAIGDSVAGILEAMGLEKTGTPRNNRRSCNVK
jgi:uncharacterized protein (UPF0210 family)